MLVQALAVAALAVARQQYRRMCRRRAEVVEPVADQPAQAAEMRRQWAKSSAGR